AIYGTKPWREHGQDDLVRYTAKDGALYAICLRWPGEALSLNAPKAGAQTQVSMLGMEGALASEVKDGKLVIQVPALTPDKVPCQHAYVF
ncbi:MAG: hypothetical protein IT364_27440, partial [Candidatus Hydrogenedentes bacterium]|nr:hypothetical protein [Candidatus Hydrogenedentota bacterium]